MVFCITIFGQERWWSGHKQTVAVQVPEKTR